MFAKVLTSFVVAVALLLGAGPAMAQSGGLLKVTDAFALSAASTMPGQVTLHWTIADHYYLYRGRIQVKATGDAVTLGQLQLPAGLKEHDPYLGDVEIYHHELTATLPYTVTDPSATHLQLAVTYQGCHEVDPKICYPPHTEHLTVPIRAAAATAAGQLPADTAGASPFLGRPLLSGDASDQGPLPPQQAFAFSAIASGPERLLLRWTMPPGYYLYRDKTTLKLVDAQGITLGTPQWPTGMTHHDEYFGSTIVYFDEVNVPVPLSRARGSGDRVTLVATFQGCKQHSICYPPMTRKVTLKLPGDAAVVGATSVAMAGSPRAAIATEVAPTGGMAGSPRAAIATEVAPTVDPAAASGVGSTTAAAAGVRGPSAVQALAGSLAGGGRWWALLGFFGAGLLLAFTPCVLPMIPILSGLIAGAGEKLSTGRALVLSVVYVLASSVVFVIAGVIAGVVGASVQAAFQSPWLLTAFALLFVLLALSMFGFYELRPPAALQRRITAASNRQHGGSLVGVAVMGVLSALIVGPCVAPPLAGAVLYIAQTHDPAFGALALFALSLGMGVPLVIFGVAAGRWLPRAGAWMKTVQAVFGVIFLALAIWMLSRFLAPLWIMLMTGVLLVGCAVFMGAFDRPTEGTPGWRRLWKALGLVLLVLGAAELVGTAAGSRNLLQPLAVLGGTSRTAAAPAPVFRPVTSVADLKQSLAAAQAAGKPVMLDFYADWCVSCKEMEHRTFTQPAVRAAMSHFVLLQADVTANNAADRALLNHFGLFGPPATIFYGEEGHELTGLRLIGFEGADDFVARLAAARRG